MNYLKLFNFNNTQDNRLMLYSTDWMSDDIKDLSRFANMETKKDNKPKTNIVNSFDKVNYQPKEDAVPKLDTKELTQLPITETPKKPYLTSRSGKQYQDFDYAGYEGNAADKRLAAKNWYKNQGLSGREAKDLATLNVLNGIQYDTYTGKKVDNLDLKWANDRKSLYYMQDGNLLRKPNYVGRTIRNVALGMMGPLGWAGNAILNYSNPKVHPSTTDWNSAFGFKNQTTSEDPNKASTTTKPTSGFTFGFTGNNALVNNDRMQMLYNASKDNAMWSNIDMDKNGVIDLSDFDRYNTTTNNTTYGVGDYGFANALGLGDKVGEKGQFGWITNPNPATVSTTPPVATSNEPGSVVKTPQLISWEQTKYGKEAVNRGFKSADLVAAWQKMVGLIPDKQFGQNSIERYDALLKAGYKRRLNSDGSYSLTKNGIEIKPNELTWNLNKLQEDTIINAPKFNYNTWNANTGYNIRNDANSDNLKLIESGNYYMGGHSYGKKISDYDLRRLYAAQYRKKLNGQHTLEKNWWMGNKDATFENNYNTWKNNLKLHYNKHTNSYYFKQGGILKKFQQGGQMEQENSQEQILTYATLGLIGYANAKLLPMDFQTAISQVMQLAQSKPEALLEIASNKELILSGLEIMKLQEPEVLQTISQPGGMKKILAQLQQNNQTQMAKQGTKLEYIKALKGMCPEGYETSYMKAGGKVCPVCKKKHEAEKRAMKREVPADRQGGAISSVMNLIKASLYQNGGQADTNDAKVKQLQQQRDALLKQALSLKGPEREATMKKVRELNKQIGSLGVEE